MSELDRSEELPKESFAEAILGKGTLEAKSVQPLMAWSPTRRMVVSIVAFASLLFLPYLGAVGLWDPWETHYGEVARAMIQRNDYVYPYWESAWFFSKPVLTMWLQALGMQLAGTMRVGVNEPLALYTEWGFRLPFVILSIASVALLGLAVSRVVSRRAGLATAFVLCTMPLYFLLTRQAVTDTPFVTTLTCAMACAIIGQLDEHTKHRSAWWYAFYAFAGFSCLAKGVLGIGIPAVVLFLYAVLCVLPTEGGAWDAHVRWLTDGGFRRDVNEGRRAMPVLWAQLFRMRFGTGFLVWAAIAVPWYLTLSLFTGVDDEGKDFFTRFFIHDHLNRLGAGVHTTTPGGNFTYFIEQGGYAIYPWVALVPGAIATVARLRLRGGSRADHLAVISVIWAAFTFGLMTMSATKFHHYVFPVLPAAAVLIALFIDRLWEEGSGRHGASLMFGLLFFIIVGKDLAANPKNFTDLFVYNYDRPYPMKEVTEKAISLFSYRTLFVGDLLAVVMLGLGGYLAFDAFSGKERRIGARATALGIAATGLALLIVMATRGGVSPKMFVGVALLLTAAYLAMEAMRPDATNKNAAWAITAAVGFVGAVLLLRALSYRGAPDSWLASLLDPVNAKVLMGLIFTVGGVLCVVAALLKQRTMLFGSFWATAFVFALWFNWGHWVSLSHHWTQRDQFWRYYQQRNPDEPITAFLMNWRGETYYSRNTVKQIKDNGRLYQYAQQPGREWALVEHNRIGILRGAVGPDKNVTVVDPDLNNKFVLVKIE